MNRELAVRVDDCLVAYLLERPDGAWSLVYHDDAPGSPKSDISVNFPSRGVPYQDPNLNAFFRNLLPDESTKRVLTQRLGVTEGNDFALLSAVCGETFGALRIEPAGGNLFDAGALRVLTEQELRHLVAALPQNPLLTEVHGFRASLPGHNPKIPVRIVGDAVALPLGRELSTHVAKPARDGLRESVYNEAFCSGLAERLGLPVASVELRHGSATVLLSQRIDRTLIDGVVHALPAEDFCQLSLLPPDRAFEREGGLTAGECVQIVRRYSVAPAPDIRALLKWVIFNYLVGNGRAHAKHLAIINGEQGPRLAPFFGLMSTHVYPHLNAQLAMRIGAEDRPDWVIPDRWRELGTAVGVRPSYLIELLEEIAIASARVCGTFAEEFQQQYGFASVITNIRRLVERRSRQVLVSLQAEAV